ncbi:MAG: toxic anion resistance protein [Eubacterium sp.]|nr:toxic anion resistance protein [Eubacterium sp.]MDD7209272.1 toxic anion resistance protein [Lachnospiraceae bacterium]
MNIEELLKEGPSLTFDVEPEPVTELKEMEKPAPKVYEEEQYLTEKEKKQVEDFVDKIQLEDSTSVLQYGAGAQKKMSDFSEGALEKVRTSDLGEIGDLLSGVVSEVKGFDEEEEKGVFGFFRKKASKLQSLKLRYEKAEKSIDEICDRLESHQVQLMKDSAMFDQLYELNKVYFRELTMYILAGKKKLEKEYNEVIPELKRKAQESGRQEDAQEVSDREALCNRFEKKIHDLELTRMVSLQMAPQIRLVQSGDITMSEKIQSTLVNTIPLWKSQMIIALGMEHSKEAAKAQRQVTDLTNDLLRKNSEKLKTVVVETAKENERGIVDMETLVQTNENLLSTIDEVMQIQEEGREKRREAEEELAKLENDLKEKLLSQAK